MRNLHTITEAQRGFYNDALRRLELPTVRLDAIQVDRMGWSPQVAEALAGEGIQTDYLRVGGVQYAIIVSPLQASAPVLMPAHSFDALCVDRFFSEAANKVANLTEQGAIVVTMARNIDVVEIARNLQHVEHVTIEVDDTAGIMLAARQQREDAAKIRDDDDACFDDELRLRLLTSGRQYGDLRHKALEIPTLTFGDVRSFGTELVAGGAWIFRDLPGGRVVTVVRECEHGEKPSPQYVSISDREDSLQLLQRLVKAEMLTPSPERFKEASARAQKMRLAILAAAARDHYPKAVLAGANDIARRRLAEKLNGNLPSAYHALDRFSSLVLEKTRRDEAAKLIRDEGLLPWLAEPSSDVTPGTAAALSSLLAAIAPEDVLRFRQFNRLSYRRARQEWPATYVAWVDEQISLAETQAGD